MHICIYIEIKHPYKSININLLTHAEGVAASLTCLSVLHCREEGKYNENEQCYRGKVEFLRWICMW